MWKCFFFAWFQWSILAVYHRRGWRAGLLTRLFSQELVWPVAILKRHRLSAVWSPAVRWISSFDKFNSNLDISRHRRTGHLSLARREKREEKCNYRLLMAGESVDVQANQTRSREQNEAFEQKASIERFRNVRPLVIRSSVSTHCMPTRSTDRPTILIISSKCSFVRAFARSVKRLLTVERERHSLQLTVEWYAELVSSSICLTCLNNLSWRINAVSDDEDLKYISWGANQR